MTTVVMTHGAFCGGWAFARFRRPFEALGWTVLTPDLRGHGPDDPDGAVAGLSMADYVADLAKLCADLPEPPILVGHSMGGLVTQMAARRVRPQALVLLAPSPPWGVTGSSIEEAIAAVATPLVDPFLSGTAQPDRGIMARYGLDRLGKPERDALLAKLRPESARAIREVLNWWLDPFMTTSVGALPCPALAIAGSRDVVHPSATVRASAARSGMAFQEMAGMSHWLIGEPGWEEVAEIAIRWLSSDAQAAA
jgi:pimeloyl-ACP methyl ester carboxylesterase